MVRIIGVNNAQRDMLDHMWSLNDYDDILEWKETLSDQDRQQADLLEEMILLAVVDEMFEEDDFKEANTIINSITNKLKDS